MSDFPQFTIGFQIGFMNKERSKAFEMYHRAFKAKKHSENVPPNGDDIRIMTDKYGLEILIDPGRTTGTGFDNALCFEIRFD